MSTVTAPITLETVYAELLEIKTLLRSAPPSAALAEKVAKVSKKAAKAAKAAAEGPKEPSTNPWILFSKRVEGIVRSDEAARGVEKEAAMKTTVAKQFASDLKSRKPYDSWTDDEIRSEIASYVPPEKSKQELEGKSKKLKKEAASAASSEAGSAAGSDDEAEAAAPAKKPRKPMSEEAKKKAAEKRAATLAAKKAGAAAPAAPAEEEFEDAEDEAEAPPAAPVPAPAPAPAAGKKVAIKPKAKPAEAPKALDLRFYAWEHNGQSYFTNERGDVVTTEFEWVGRFANGKLDESAPEPADLENAQMKE